MLESADDGCATKKCLTQTVFLQVICVVDAPRGAQKGVQRRRMFFSRGLCTHNGRMGCCWVFLVAFCVYIILRGE